MTLFGAGFLCAGNCTTYHLIPPGDINRIGGLNLGVYDAIAGDKVAGKMRSFSNE